MYLTVPQVNYTEVADKTDSSNEDEIESDATIDAASN